MMEIDRRANSDVEIRSYPECRIESSDDRRIDGLAIVFNSMSATLFERGIGHFKEVISPDAADRMFSQAADIRGLVDHDSSKIIGRTRSGTMVLRKEARGVRAVIEPDLGISYARDIMLSVRRGDVSGMSFAFHVTEGGDNWDFRDEMPVRTIHDMTVSEVSVVTFPAYPDTTVAFRSLQEFRTTTAGSRLAWLKKVHKTRLAR